MSGPTLLAKYLAKTKITATALGARAGLHQSVLSNLLSGRRQAGLATAFAIEKATRGAVPASAWLVGSKPRKVA